MKKRLYFILSIIVSFTLLSSHINRKDNSVLCLANVEALAENNESSTGLTCLGILDGALLHAQNVESDGMHSVQQCSVNIHVVLLNNLISLYLRISLKAYSKIINTFLYETLHKNVFILRFTFSLFLLI